MKIKNIKKILAWGCFLIFFVLGYYFYKIEWDILSIIFFVSGIISLLLAYYDNNQETQNKKELKCPKCKIGNQLYNLNNNHNSTIFIYKEHGSKIKLKDGLDIFLLICFKCREITKWALNNNNISKDENFDFQYFETRVITREDLSRAIQEAEQSCSVHSIDKLKNISI